MVPEPADRDVRADGQRHAPLLILRNHTDVLSTLHLHRLLRPVLVSREQDLILVLLFPHLGEGAHLAIVHLQLPRQPDQHDQLAFLKARGLLLGRCCLLGLLGLFTLRRSLLVALVRTLYIHLVEPPQQLQEGWAVPPLCEEGGLSGDELVYTSADRLHRGAFLRRRQILVTDVGNPVCVLDLESEARRLVAQEEALQLHGSPGSRREGELATRG
mmetsp:Transcript_50279/g.132927  ORF Transcript_50279/g.132927 Transcript_50279/m.132927 type:complete len:215 (+) Transcript_50279:509-1153(+)